MVEGESLNRSEFLRRARDASSAATLPAHPGVDPGGWVPELAEVDLVDHFSSRLIDVQGDVSTGPPARVIDELIDHHAVESFVSWDIEEIEGLDELPDIERVEAWTPGDPVGRRDRNLSFAGVALGITGAEAGFAETGTIVLRSGRGRPRMASLVPLVHVAVLSRDRLYRSPSHWARDRGETIATSANVIFITGPSKTGDIESTITHGIHGPKHVHVILV